MILPLNNGILKGRFWKSTMKKTETDYLFEVAFEAIICTGIQGKDIPTLRKSAHEYYKIAIENDAVRNSLFISKRQLAEP